MRKIFLIVVFGLTFGLLSVVAGDALAQAQPTPEQTIAIQQSMLARANACVDVYRDRDAIIANANAQIEALKKQLAEASQVKK